MNKEKLVGKVTFGKVQGSSVAGKDDKNTKKIADSMEELVKVSKTNLALTKVGLLADASQFAKVTAELGGMAASSVKRLDTVMDKNRLIDSGEIKKDYQIFNQALIDTGYMLKESAEGGMIKIKDAVAKMDEGNAIAFANLEASRVNVVNFTKFIATETAKLPMSIEPQKGASTSSGIDLTKSYGSGTSTWTPPSVKTEQEKFQDIVTGMLDKNGVTRNTGTTTSTNNIFGSFVPSYSTVNTCSTTQTETIK